MKKEIFLHFFKTWDCLYVVCLVFSGLLQTYADNFLNGPFWVIFIILQVASIILSVKVFSKYSKLSKNLNFSSLQLIGPLILASLKLFLPLLFLDLGVLIFIRWSNPTNNNLFKEIIIGESGLPQVLHWVFLFVFVFQLSMVGLGSVFTLWQGSSKDLFPNLLNLFFEIKKKITVYFSLIFIIGLLSFSFAFCA